MTTSTSTSTVTSADGTTIAYQSFGDGPAVVIVGGATNVKDSWVELAQALAGAGFTGVTYDRRGRGESGDTRPFAVEREVEDLAAVIDAVGAPAGVHTVSSGGGVGYRAAAAGVPIATMSAFETPYRPADGPQVPGYVEHLQELYDADRRSEMVEYFMTTAVGQPPEAVAQMKQQPFWAGLEAIGPTILYDGLQLGGGRMGVPVDLLSQVTVPVLCVASTGSADWMREASSAAANVLPGGAFTVLEGEFHQVPVPVLTPVLAAHHAR
jgi:pimeloyl-ACP methyl ester carboxylesterase